MNSSSVDPYLALRPRSHGWLVTCALLACCCVAWVAWCCVCVAHEWAVRGAVEACSASAQTWTGSSCVASEVHVHLEAPPQKNPLMGPGGA